MKLVKFEKKLRTFEAHPIFTGSYKNKHESANKLWPRTIYCRNSSFNIYYIFNIDFLCNQITQNDITNKCSILILSE